MQSFPIQKTETTLTPTTIAHNLYFRTSERFEIVISDQLRPLIQREGFLTDRQYGLLLSFTKRPIKSHPILLVRRTR